MQIYAPCPHCNSSLLFDTSTDHERKRRCVRCDGEVQLSFSENIRDRNTVDACPCCGKRAFYVQKDFNRNLGLGIVILCALVGLYYVWQDRPTLFYVALGVAVVIDALLYFLLPEVTVCYACVTVFRKADRNPEHQGFDLHIADIYEGRSQGYAERR